MNYLISQFLQLLDNDGNPLTGGKIFVYKRGLPELADVYLDFEGHLNTNPVILDSTGHAVVIVNEGRFYDVIVQNKDGEQMWSMNNVSCIGYGEIIRREDVYHDDTLEGKGTEDEPLSVVGGGLSTVYTADPITGDGSEENPVTISDIVEIAHDDTMVHSYEGDNLVLGVNPSKFVAAGQKVDNAANADYATRALNDSNGNNIVNTYATKSEIPDIPDLSNYAQKDGTYNDMTVGHATVADTANTASSADWATNAGTAGTASTATHALSADQATNASNANWATNATNATNDSAGNNISSTYFKKEGGALNGKLSAKGTGSASKDQAAVIYAQVTNTSTNNQSGLGTNGSVWAGDYNSATSQTIGVRRKVGDNRLAGRFQLYSDGNVSFQQISNNGTADSITCQLQYGETTSGNNWGTMTFGNETKHIAYTEDMETVLWEGTYENGTFPDITLSESYKNFEYLEVTLDSYYTTNYPRSEVIQKFSTDKLAIDGACMSFTVTTFNSDNTYSYVHFISYKMSSETVIQAQFQSMYRQSIPVNTGNVTIANGRRDNSSAYEYGITKVVGINRKAGN